VATLERAKNHEVQSTGNTKSITKVNLWIYIWLGTYKWYTWYRIQVVHIDLILSFTKTHCTNLFFLVKYSSTGPRLRICSWRNEDLITHTPLYVVCVYVSRWVLIRTNRSCALHGCNARSYNARSYMDVTHVRTRCRSLMHMYIRLLFILIYISIDMVVCPDASTCN